MGTLIVDTSEGNTRGSKWDNSYNMFSKFLEHGYDFLKLGGKSLLGRVLLPPLRYFVHAEELRGIRVLVSFLPLNYCTLKRVVEWTWLVNSGERKWSCLPQFLPFVLESEWPTWSMSTSLLLHAVPFIDRLSIRKSAVIPGYCVESTSGGNPLIWTYMLY